MEAARSLYEFLHPNIDKKGRLVEGFNYCLPDRSELAGFEAIPWIPGKEEEARPYMGVRNIRHDQKAGYIADLVIRLSNNDDEVLKKEICGQLLKDDLIGYVNPALDKIIPGVDPGSPVLKGFARDLAFKSPDRGPVRFGIVLLGIFGDEEDLEKARILGAHPDFTTYTIIALEKAFLGDESCLCRYGERLYGPAKAHLVESLWQTNNEATKRWLLLEGYKNLDAQSLDQAAATIAETGDLKAALSQDKVEHTLLVATGELIKGIIGDEVHRSIMGDVFPAGDSYPDLPQVIMMFLTKIIGEQDEHSFTVSWIEQYILKDDRWQSREEAENWDSQMIEQIRLCVDRFREDKDD